MYFSESIFSDRSSLLGLGGGKTSKQASHKQTNKAFGNSSSSKGNKSYLLLTHSRLGHNTLSVPSLPSPNLVVEVERPDRRKNNNSQLNFEAVGFAIESPPNRYHNRSTSPNDYYTRRTENLEQNSENAEKKKKHSSSIRILNFT